MQNRYTADLGDFGKYGMLRALCAAGTEGEATLSLGVMWYLVPDEDHNADGKHVRYLNATPKNTRTFRECDPDLYDELSAIVKANNRSVAQIQARGLPMPNSVFHEEVLDYATTPIRSRLEYRGQWVNRGLTAVTGRDVVFTDPDNGFEIPSCEPHHIDGGKFAYFDELRRMADRGQSLVIYHHLNRSRPAAEEIKNRFGDIREKLGENPGVFALYYHRGTARVFFVVPCPQRAKLLLERARTRIEQGPWRRHFDLVVP